MLAGAGSGDQGLVYPTRRFRRLDSSLPLSLSVTQTQFSLQIDRPSRPLSFGLLSLELLRDSFHSLLQILFPANPSQSLPTNFLSPASPGPGVESLLLDAVAVFSLVFGIYERLAILAVEDAFSCFPHSPWLGIQFLVVAPLNCALHYETFSLFSESFYYSRLLPPRSRSATYQDPLQLPNALMGSWCRPR